MFVILSLAIFTSGCTQQGRNTTQNDMTQNTTQNSTVQNNTNVSCAIKDYNAIITQSGPSTTQKRGTSVVISYMVTNSGKNTIYNAKIGAQDFAKDIGTLNPGQTKKYTYMQYIPTTEDLTSMGIHAKLTSPLEIGSIILTYTDNKGNYHSIRSNQIAIKFK
jgi:hypothetical protein